jgi:inorganic pyrophosphatase
VEVEVVIEVPQGSRNKYEMDPVSARIRLDRMLFTSTRYPADYGFVPGTLAEDGDPVAGPGRRGGRHQRGLGPGANTLGTAR